MQLSDIDKKPLNISEQLSNYFKDRINNVSIFDTTNDPYALFSIRFKMYDYFIVILIYDRGRFGCVIDHGSGGISLDNSQKWYDQADMKIFMQELEQQIELRIPDKFLEYHGWK